MAPTPIWLLPVGYNPSEAEGRIAAREGKDIEACRYGESVAGDDWRRGYKAEVAKSVKALLAPPNFNNITPGTV